MNKTYKLNKKSLKLIEKYFKIISKNLNVDVKKERIKKEYEIISYSDFKPLIKSEYTYKDIYIDIFNSFPKTAKQDISFISCIINKHPYLYDKLNKVSKDYLKKYFKTFSKEFVNFDKYFQNNEITVKNIYLMLKIYENKYETFDCSIKVKKIENFNYINNEIKEKILDVTKDNITKTINLINNNKRIYSLKKSYYGQVDYNSYNEKEQIEEEDSYFYDYISSISNVLFSFNNLLLKIVFDYTKEKDLNYLINDSNYENAKNIIKKYNLIFQETNDILLTHKSKNKFFKELKKPEKYFHYASYKEDREIDLNIEKLKKLSQLLTENKVLLFVNENIENSNLDEYYKKIKDYEKNNTIYDFIIDSKNVNQFLQNYNEDYKNYFFALTDKNKLENTIKTIKEKGNVFISLDLFFNNTKNLSEIKFDFIEYLKNINEDNLKHSKKELIKFCEDYGIIHFKNKSMKEIYLFFLNEYSESYSNNLKFLIMIINSQLKNFKKDFEKSLVSIKNSKEYVLTHEDLYNKDINNNKIANLIEYLIEKNIIPIKFKRIFASYEVIFRHQFAHGCNDFFKALLIKSNNCLASTERKIFTAYNNNNDFNEKKLIISYSMQSNIFINEKEVIDQEKFRTHLTKAHLFLPKQFYHQVNGNLYNFFNEEELIFKYKEAETEKTLNNFKMYVSSEEGKIIDEKIKNLNLLKSKFKQEIKETLKEFDNGKKECYLKKNDYQYIYDNIDNFIPLNKDSYFSLNNLIEEIISFLNYYYSNT